MAKIIPVHSFRRGTGKSTLAANLAALLAGEGRRVGLMDTNLQSPSLHILFNLSEDRITYTLNDYLSGRCDILQTAYRLSLPADEANTPFLFLIPASTRPEEIRQALQRGYNMDDLGASFDQFITAFNLDLLLIDTASGLIEETLVSIALSDILLILLRTDQQDYQGTGITIQVAHKLNVPRIMLIVNEIPAFFDEITVKAELSQTYNCEVAAVLPHLDELMALASAEIFSLRYPHHPLTTLLKQVAHKLLI